jgi:protein-S-isoprenylcysteine O-methyltransferase Ste14
MMKKRYVKKNVMLIAAILLLVIIAQPNVGSLTVGGIFVLAGELIRVWATGHLKRNQEVTTSGPYAYLRDPLYLGRLFLLIGFCVMAQGYALYLFLPVGLCVFAYSYMPRKYKKEMARLERHFGDEYVQYSSYCRSLLPKLKPYAGADNRKWSISLFWFENREQYFILIVVSIFAAIIFKLK